MNGNGMMKKDRKVDIIFCIDGTGSMTPCIDSIKNNAKKFYRDLVDKMTTDFNSSIDELNIKVITFRDYAVDPDAMVISEWFDLTAGDTDLYEKHLDGIVAQGGDDIPENGLEALYFAMTADWKSIGMNDRQVIVLFTDADAKPIGTNVTKADGTTVDMVDEAGLINTWAGVIPPTMSQSNYRLKERAKRLIIYAPAMNESGSNESQYAKLAKNLNRTQFVPTVMNMGMREIDFTEVIKILAASASADF